MPASPTQPAVTLRSTWLQGQAPPGDNRTESAAVPTTWAGEAKAAASAVTTPQATGAVASSSVATANEAATRGCLTFAPPAAGAAAASMLSPGVDAVARDEQHRAVRSLTAVFPLPICTLQVLFCSGAVFAGDGSATVHTSCSNMVCAMHAFDDRPSCPAYSPAERPAGNVIQDRPRPSSTPRAQRSSKRQRRPSTPFHFAAEHRPMGLMALPTPSNWAVMAVEPCTAQPPVARALFAAVGEGAKEDSNSSAGDRPSESSETTTLTDRHAVLAACDLQSTKQSCQQPATCEQCC